MGKFRPFPPKVYILQVMKLHIYNDSHIGETFGGSGDGSSSSNKQQIMLLTSCLCYLL